MRKKITCSTIHSRLIKVQPLDSAITFQQLASISIYASVLQREKLQEQEAHSENLNVSEYAADLEDKTHKKEGDVYD